eukprot:5633920-Amphidinium_carterae.2
MPTHRQLPRIIGRESDIMKDPLRLAVHTARSRNVSFTNPCLNAYTLSMIPQKLHPVLQRGPGPASITLNTLHSVVLRDSDVVMYGHVLPNRSSPLTRGLKLRVIDMERNNIIIVVPNCDD